MKSYPPGVDVTVTVPFLDLNGDPVDVISAVARVFDETETQVGGDIVLALSGGETEIDVEVPGARNMLPDDAYLGMRTVEVVMTTAAGIFPARVSYRIRGSAGLTVLVNSFQTYSQALLTASEMPRLFDWNLGSDDDRRASLIESFLRLKRIPYLIPPLEFADTQSRVVGIATGYEIPPGLWDLMTLDEFAQYPERFRQALRRAQVAEANFLMRGAQGPDDKRRLGLMSESIGESSMMFRPGKSVELAVSRESLEHLKGYLNVNVRLARG